MTINDNINSASTFIHPSPSNLTNSNSVTIKFLLISGKKAKFSFNSNTNFQSIKEYILKNWPQEWSSEARVSEIQNLRIVYQGHFVSEDITLNSLKLLNGHSTTMHLLITDTNKRDGELKNSNKKKKENQQQSCIGCIIL